MASLPYQKRAAANRLYLSLAALAILIVIVAVMFDSRSEAEESASQSNSATQAPDVEVQVIKQENLRLWHEFSGRIEAVDHVEIRPQVSGKITEILFKEGAVVKKGDALFTIDPRPFEAEVASAKAAVESAKSNVELTKAELARAKSLVGKQVISKSRFDELNNAHKVALANVKSAEARLERATLDLDYAHIKAPVSGRVSRAELTVGNLVESGQSAPVLTTIVANDKFYADFDVDEQTYINTVRGMDSELMPVELKLSGDKEYSYKGFIQSFDNQLNKTTGTIRARAIFDNIDGALVPGMFANVRLGTADEEPVMIIPDKAIGTDQNKKYVYVVDDTNQVVYREITVGQTVGEGRKVLSGISEGEKIMVNSLQRVQPGMKVNPVSAGEMKKAQHP